MHDDDTIPHAGAKVLRGFARCVVCLQIRPAEAMTRQASTTRQHFESHPSEPIFLTCRACTEDVERMRPQVERESRPRLFDLGNIPEDRQRRAWHWDRYPK